MGLAYLNGQSWKKITREERFFCLELYRELSDGGVDSFVKYLYSKGVAIDPFAKFEVGYEVCFYRDLEYRGLFRGDIEKGYSPKRTFDLCLFSEEEMIIIEAKVFEGMTNDQMDDFEQDREWVPNAVGIKNYRVHLLALTSSIYKPKADTRKRFDKMLTWMQISELFPNNKLLVRADEIFSEKPVKRG